MAADIEKNLIKKFDNINCELNPITKDVNANLLLTRKGIEVFTELGNYLDKMEKLLRDFLGTEEILKASVRAGIKLNYEEEIIPSSRLPEIRKIDEN